MCTKQEPMPRDVDRFLTRLMIGTGMFPIILAVVRGGSWGVEPSLGLLIVLFAASQCRPTKPIHLDNRRFPLA